MSERRESVVMAFCHPGMVHTVWFHSVIKAFTHDAMNRGVIQRYLQMQSAYIPDARNKLCALFLETDAEWLWFVDYDVVFEPWHVYMLLDAADPIERPIIAGCYFSKYVGNDVVLPVWFEHRDGEDLCPVMDVTAGEIRPLTVAGMGFTMIHRSVIETLKVVHADDPWHWFGHDLIGKDRVGEDITFSHRARQAGFTIWGHSGVLLDHQKQHMENWSTFVNQDPGGLSRGRGVTVRR